MTQNPVFMTDNGSPNSLQLKTDMQQMSMVKVGKKYGVSDNSIRKWVKQYEKET